MINLIVTCPLVYKCAEIPCLSIIPKNPTRDNAYYSELLGCSCFYTIENLINKVKKLEESRLSFTDKLHKHMKTHAERLECDLFVIQIINFFEKTVNNKPEEIKEGENKTIDYEMNVDDQKQTRKSEWFDKCLHLNLSETKPNESDVERKKRICKEFAVSKVNEFTRNLKERTIVEQFEIAEMCFKFFNLDTFECMHGSECSKYKKEESVLEESSME